MRTESEDDGTHAIFFNRGVVASQAYANRFDNKPARGSDPEAYQWPRAAFEAMDEFIGQAKNSWYAIRAQWNEFARRDTDAFGARATVEPTWRSSSIAPTWPLRPGGAT